MSMSCTDGPALPCNETGCPAPIINCSFLAANNACELPIEKIWEKSAPISHPMPVWMYCGISCKQCGSDSLTEAELDRIALHDGPAAPERKWGAAGNQLNSGARHTSIYVEMTEARRACDAERLWRPAGGDDSQLNHDYLYHESVRDLDCDKPLPTPEATSWAQRTRATLSAIRRGVDRFAQGKSLSKAKVAAGLGAAAETTEGGAAPGRVPLWLCAIRIQKLMGYNSYSKAFRCAQRVHSDTVLNYPRSLAPSVAPKLLRCTVAARGGVGGMGTDEPPYNWTFTRAGPFVGHGGYDWHTTLWSDAMGTEVSMDARGHTAAADVNSWFLGPTSEGGEPMGFPPVHMHHAHIRNGCTSAYRRTSYASPKPFGKSETTSETAKEPGEACPSADWVNATAQRSGALVFESHQDSMCHDDKGSESAPPGSATNGARCYLKVLPAGAAIRVVPPLRLDAQLNDVRPIAAPNETPLAPLNMYFQVGLRWRAAPARTRAPDDATTAAAAAAAAATPAAPRVAAAALVTVGNPGSEPTDTSSKDSQKPEYSALTGKLRLMLARGSRDVPTLWYAGFTLPLAISASAAPLDVHSMYVHWHQRIASSVFCLAALPSQLGLPPLLLPHSPLQLPATNGTAYAALVRRLLAHPALRCASAPSSGLQFVPARPGASAAGWYDRRPHVYCVDGWQVRPGDNLTFIWLDERHANPYAAVARAAASTTWSALPRTAFAVDGADAATAAATAEQLQGAGPAYESTMSGVIGPPTVVPQHYIARLILIANKEEPASTPAAAAAATAAAAAAAQVAVATGHPARSAGPLQCCCVAAVQVIRNSASNPRLAELRSMYQDETDPGHAKMKNGILVRTPAPGNHSEGTELWRWGWRSGTMRGLGNDDIHCGGWAANVNCG